MSELEIAEKKLEDFIKANRNMIPFQIRLSREMDEQPEENRITVILKHLINNLDELNIELQLLEMKIKELTEKKND